jgi:site-specific recombinase XerD
MNPTTPMRPPSSSADLFDTPNEWLSFPILAYSSWLSSLDGTDTAYSEGSKKVYISMWTKFIRYLDERHISLPLVQSHHISSFLDVHALKKEHRQRYVRLIEKTYKHLIELQLVTHNPGQKAGYERVGKGSNDSTRFLSDTERDRLFGVLRQAFESADKKGTDKQREEQWRRVRNAVVAATMIGGGLKVSEAASITVNCTQRAGVITVPDSYGKEHVARLFPIAQDALAAWWPWRAEKAEGSNLVFPAEIKKRRNDQRVKTVAMHATTVYKHVAALMEEAGITGDRACCQTLRNTYAAMLIEQGASDAELSECLGLQLTLSAHRMREAHKVASFGSAGDDEPK